MAIPVSLEDARRQLRMEVDDTSRDDDLTDWIADAANWVEGYTGHILEAREVSHQACGRALALVRGWPISNSLVAIIYDDAAGVTVTTTGGRLDASSRPARFYPPQAGMPFVDQRYSYRITYRAGYELDQAVPGNMRRAMLVLISAYDADREGGDVLQKAIATAERLCRDFRLRRV